MMSYEKRYQTIGRAQHCRSLPRPNSNGPKRRGVILGRRQRPWAIGARPQRGRPDGAQAGPRHGNTAPGESVRAIAQRFRGGPSGPRLKKPAGV